MTSKILQEIINQIDCLKPQEQLELISYIAQKARQSQIQPREKWRNIRGLVKQPALGEDAQVWISRSRQE